MKTVLVINSGSSSIKYQLVDTETGKPLASGLIERIGEKLSDITHKTGGESYSEQFAAPTHSEGLQKALDFFDQYGPSIANSNCAACGHRVVQGGSIFPKPAIVDESVIAQIRELSALAPLHNPAAAIGIEVALKLLPNIPHIAVFDSSFFFALPESASAYAIDKATAEKYAIRRYGAHGTSHQFVGNLVAEFLNADRKNFKQIVLHIGNGASASAQIGNSPIDTSMGLTPLEGLVMGSRTGDIDPAVVFHLARNANMSIDEIDTLLNKKSGMLGMAGESDMRSISDLISKGDADAKLAFEVYCRRIAKYIGAYIAMLGGCDAITFTAGVGENDAAVRSKVIGYFEFMGIKIDPELNVRSDDEVKIISTSDSKCKVLVAKTNEELAIASIALETIK